MNEEKLFPTFLKWRSFRRRFSFFFSSILFSIENENSRKEINTEAVQMSEYEVKHDGSYVHAKDPLYFPSPYATSRVPAISLEERSSGDSSTEGRSTLHHVERQYDIPFALKQVNSLVTFFIILVWFDLF